MDIDLLVEKLKSGMSVYLYDDYEQVVVKYKLDRDRNRSIVFLKRKGRKEIESSESSSVVFETRMGGEEVTEEFYENF